MRGSFSALPDSFSIVISGDIIFDDVVATIEKQFSDIALYGTAPSVRGEDDTHMLFALHPDADAMRKRAKEGVLRVEDVESLKENYLFREISQRVNKYLSAHPDNKLIRMGIGDVTQPLAPVVVDAMKKASAEMGDNATFRGYEDSGQGYDFLREAIKGYYKDMGLFSLSSP